MEPTWRLATERRLERGSPEIWRWFSQAKYCALGQSPAQESSSKTEVELLDYHFSIPGNYSSVRTERRFYHGGMSWAATGRNLAAGLGHFGCAPRPDKKEAKELTCAIATDNFFGFLYRSRSRGTINLGAVILGPGSATYDLSLSTSARNKTSVREFLSILRSVKYEDMSTNEAAAREGTLAAHH